MKKKILLIVTSQLIQSIRLSNHERKTRDSLVRILSPNIYRNENEHAFLVIPRLSDLRARICRKGEISTQDWADRGDKKRGIKQSTYLRTRCRGGDSVREVTTNDHARLLPLTLDPRNMVTVYTVCYASDRVERLSSRRSRILTHRDHRDLENLARVLRAMLFSRKSSDEDGTGEAETVCKVSETSRVSPYRFPLEFFPLLFR